VDPRVLEHHVEGRTILAAVRRAGRLLSSMRGSEPAWNERCCACSTP